jgi:hypothetical protein
VCKYTSYVWCVFFTICGQSLRFVSICLRNFLCVWQLEDIKGLPSSLCCKGVGSVIGACPWCNVVGIRAHGSCRYPSVVRLQSQHSALGLQKRQEFRTEFTGHPEVQQLANLPPPRVNTSRDAVRSATRVQRARSLLSHTEYLAVAKEEPFLDVPVWATDLPNWVGQHLEKHGVDSSHGLKHLWVDTIDMIVQRPGSPMKFTKERRAEEATYGRFTAPGRVNNFDLLYHFLDVLSIVRMFCFSLFNHYYFFDYVHAAGICLLQSSGGGSQRPHQLHQASQLLGKDEGCTH